MDADLSLPLAPCARKGEAILTAEHDRFDFVTLLDGDCIVTGDVSPYLQYDEPGLFVRIRSGEEDAWVFGDAYLPGEPRVGIPRRVLDQWCQDVGERDQCAIRHTVCGGNLTVHTRYMPFIRRWHDQTLKVLPTLRRTHSPESPAYSQMDAWVLSSLLAFSFEPPPVRRVRLDLDGSAYVAHLGPGDPKFWVVWRWDRLKYLDAVVSLIEWGEARGYTLRRVPWTLRRSLKALSVSASALYYVYRAARAAIGSLVRCLRRLGTQRLARLQGPSATAATLVDGASGAANPCSRASA